MASTPARGPRPKSITKIMAQSSAGSTLSAERSIRTGIPMRRGKRFLLARSERGRAMPSTLPLGGKESSSSHRSPWREKVEWYKSSAMKLASAARARSAAMTLALAIEDLEETLGLLSPAAASNNPSVPKTDDGVRSAACHREVVLHEHDSRPMPILDAFQCCEDLLRALRVELGEHLVGEQHFWPLHDGPRYRHPALFSSGELSGRAVCFVGEPHFREGRSRPGEVLFREHAADGPRGGEFRRKAIEDILQHRCVLHQAEVLRDVAHLPARGP